MRYSGCFSYGVNNMAYNNYLIKLNNYVIPEKFIQYGSYQVTFSTQDLDSYRDANGVLHRNALAHKVAKVEFNTPYINSKDFNTIMSLIRAEYSSAIEKKINSVSVYIPETNSYETNAMYVPDVSVQIEKKNADGTFTYQPIRFAFIGY